MTSRTDVLIIGAGAAGLRAAIECAERGLDVIVLAKDPAGKGGITPLASEGISAPINPDDSVEVYRKESLGASMGIADPDCLEALVEESSARLLDLVQWGGQFRKNPDGTFYHPIRKGKKDNQTCNIIGGGGSLVSVLRRKAAKMASIRVYEDVMAVELLVTDGGVAGALALDLRDVSVEAIASRAVIIATGGYEELWKFTDTSSDSSGDGVALALRAGAALVDMEMVLYHPTVVIYPESARGCFVPYDLVLSGQGSVLDGSFHPVANGSEPQPEFIRLIYGLYKRGKGSPRGGCYVDFSRSPMPREALAEMMAARMGPRYKHLSNMGIALEKDVLEMAPGAHYCLGGVLMDSSGRTTVPGLFVCGEAGGNVHGAGRLFSNALAETQVFGFRAGNSAAQYVADAVSTSGGRSAERAASDAAVQFQRKVKRWRSNESGMNPVDLKKKLQQLMWDHCGPIRSGESLGKALESIRSLRQEASSLYAPEERKWCYGLRQALETENEIGLAEAVLAGALAREESRGHHYREDFPSQDPSWTAHTSVILEGGGILVKKVGIREHEGGEAPCR